MDSHTTSNPIAPSAPLVASGLVVLGVGYGAFQYGLMVYLGGFRSGSARFAFLQSAALAFPADVAVAAVVCDPTAEPSIHAVGHTRVLTLGLLGDLRQLLAKRARV